MHLTLRKFYITDKPYITEKLDHPTLSKILDSNFFVVDGIYQLKNNIQPQYNLYEEDKFGDFDLTAYVKVTYGYAGPARAQVKNVKLFKKLLYRKPKYELRINLYHQGTKQIYHYSHQYKKIERLYDDVDHQTQVLNAVLTAVLSETK